MRFGGLAANLLQNKTHTDHESKAAAAAFLDTDASAALVEPLAQQHKPGVEIFGELGQAQGPVEPQFACGKIDAAALGVLTNEFATGWRLPPP